VALNTINITIALVGGGGGILNKNNFATFHRK
jgi:hypothetical protein